MSRADSAFKFAKKNADVCNLRKKYFSKNLS